MTFEDLRKYLDHHFERHRHFNGRAIKRPDGRTRKVHAHAIGSGILVYTAGMSRNRRGGVLKLVADLYGMHILSIQNYVRFARRWTLEQALEDKRPWTDLAYERPSGYESHDCA